ncbi:MAG: hypothetical protein RBT80_13950 [Candidatus Vecturithrix sp.]|jgi:hypothetical protein|nr:hypothetical protein [Candidatus Vecturithrix sp.]
MLVKKAKGGDKHALVMLVEAIQNTIYGLALRISKLMNKVWIKYVRIAEEYNEKHYNGLKNSIIRFIL